MKEPRVSDKRLYTLLSYRDRVGMPATMFPNEVRHLALDLRDARQQLAERDQRVAALRDALGDAISTCANGRIASMGTIGNVRIPQISVSQIDRWRAALSPPSAASGGEK